MWGRLGASLTLLWMNQTGHRKSPSRSAKKGPCFGAHTWNERGCYIVAATSYTSRAQTVGVCVRKLVGLLASWWACLLCRRIIIVRFCRFFAFSPLTLGRRVKCFKNGKNVYMYLIDMSQYSSSVHLCEVYTLQGLFERHWCRQRGVRCGGGCPHSLWVNQTDHRKSPSQSAKAKGPRLARNLERAELLVLNLQGLRCVCT